LAIFACGAAFEFGFNRESTWCPSGSWLHSRLPSLQLILFSHFLLHIWTRECLCRFTIWRKLQSGEQSFSGSSKSDRTLGWTESEWNFYIEYIYRVPRAQTVLWIHHYIFCIGEGSENNRPFQIWDPFSLSLRPGSQIQKGLFSDSSLM
jgi:hypothetical protein